MVKDTELADRVAVTEEQIKIINTQLQQQDHQREELKAYTDELVRKVRLEIWNNKAAQEAINEDRNNWCDKADKNFDSLKSKLNKVDKQIADIKSYNEIVTQ